MDQTSTYSPLVMQETSDGLRLYDIRDEMLAAREIEITGAIDAGSVSTAIRNGAIICNSPAFCKRNIISFEIISSLVTFFARIDSFLTM